MNTIKRVNSQSRRENHDKAAKLRSLRENRLKNSWARIRKEVAIKELLKFVKVEMDRNREVGHSGMGFDPNAGPFDERTGTQQGQVVRFTNEQRISYMDKAEGIEEIHNYIQRHLK